ncbi:uroporphyrinogen decarboxylase family protein [Acetobacterium carbinolicum]|uniref:uroporphyrinogen decarboxylase family protein n=1 Tax=Acetobacterium carbinolicum TaxID=52690 RepID=UPI003BF5C91F
MDDIKKIQAERTKLFDDVNDSIIPKRVPVNIFLGIEPTAQYAGIDLAEAQWNPGMLEDAGDKICQTVFSDSIPFMPYMRSPALYTPLKAQSFVMGSNGFMQHPEVMGMEADEYDYLIEKPYDCLIEKVIPRHYKAVNSQEPFNTMLSFAKGLLGKNDSLMAGAGIMMKLVAKYGYRQMGLNGGSAEAPFDFIADQLRGFTGISMDIRRCPEKLQDACEAVYPIVKKMGTPLIVDDYSSVMYPLHMPTFMREKDFAKYWWPSFLKLCEDHASAGIRTSVFCEDNWMRYLDYLQDLPSNTQLTFEYGDPKIIKEKLGNKHIISGLYPISYLKNKSKQECIDLAKEYIDILAPGGKYIFALDKVPLVLDDFNMENLCAVTETVRDYGVYSNPGEQVGTVFKKEDYQAQSCRSIDSKYYQSFEQRQLENPKASGAELQKLQQLEEQLFAFVANLLM